MVREAEQYRDQDEAAREMVEKRNELEAFAAGISCDACHKRTRMNVASWLDGSSNIPRVISLPIPRPLWKPF